MTRLEKSDAQLDAEAEVRPCKECGNGFMPGFEHDHYRPADSTFTPMAHMPTDLRWLVSELRFEWDREWPVRLHGRLVTNDKLVGALGAPPWSRLFDRRMGIKRDPMGYFDLEEDDYLAYPVALGIRAVEKACRRHHRQWPDHRGEPVCWKLLQHTVKGGMALSAAADDLELTPERAELHLRWALRLCWLTRRDVINGWFGKKVRREAEAAA